ncbi:TIR domain-containing protein [Actinoplanes regularis]|nr:TIR domain-containing protein [Actinoplanes regularis]
MSVAILPRAAEFRYLESSHDARSVAVSSTRGLYLVHLDKPDTYTTLKVPTSKGGLIAFGPEDDLLAHLAGRYLTVFPIREPDKPIFVNRIEGKYRYTALAVAGNANQPKFALGDTSGVVTLIDNGAFPLEESWSINGPVDTIALTQDQRFCLFSGRVAGEVAIWDITAGVGRSLSEVGSATVITLSGDGKQAISGTSSGTVYVHDVESRELLRTFEVHTAPIVELRVLNSKGAVLSRDETGTARIFSLQGRESPKSFDVTPNRNGRLLITPDASKMVLLVGEILGTYAFPELKSEIQATEYATKRLALVGDSGVGKSTLGWRIAHSEFKPQESTHGQQFWVIDKLSTVRPDGVEVSAVLWDFAGQPEYRLVHSLFLEDIDVALVLFDASRQEEVLAGVEYWIKHLRSDTGALPDAILVGSRSDRGLAAISKEEIETFCHDNGMKLGYVETSAATGAGIDKLLQKIENAIEQQPVQVTVSTEAFQEVKQRVIRLKSSADSAAKALVPVDQLVEIVNKERGKSVPKELLVAAVRALRNHGYLGVLADSSLTQYVLFSPDLMISLASSVILEARRNPKGLGALSESDILQGRIVFPEIAGMTREQQRILLDAVVLLFISRDLCFRESLGSETFLVFPALINQGISLAKRRDTDDFVTYRISGNVENVYSALVVLLGYTNTFKRAKHWRDNAEYELDSDQICGFRQIARASGVVDIVLSYAPPTSVSARLLFQGLVEEFLKRRNIMIERFPSVSCNACKYIQERSTVVRRMTERRTFINCEECGERSPLPSITIVELPGQIDGEVQVQQRVARGRSAYQSALVHVKSIARDRGLTKPTCFISYAWGQWDDDKWVHQLARDLEVADVAVILDVWNNSSAGASVPRFLERIDKSDFIIVVGSPAYRQKYENDVSEFGSIVAAEVDLINNRMTGRESNKSSVLPLLRSGTRQHSLPPLLQGRVTYDMTTEENYFPRLLDIVLTLFKLDFQDATVENLRERFRI